MYNLEQQQKEIKTIRKRTIKIELSDADVKSISEKAGANGLSVAGLLKNFIGDLVDGTYSNGSDERMYAEEWFDRCGFSYGAEETFLRFLLEYEILGYLLERIDDLSENIRYKNSLETRLQDDILFSQENSCYNKEWQDEQKETLAEVEEEILSAREEINEIWEGFLNWKENCNNEIDLCSRELKEEYDWGELFDSFKMVQNFYKSEYFTENNYAKFDEEMEKVFEWLQEYQLLQSEENANVEN